MSKYNQYQYFEDHKSNNSTSSLLLSSLNKEKLSFSGSGSGGDEGLASNSSISASKTQYTSDKIRAQNTFLGSSASAPAATEISKSLDKNNIHKNEIVWDPTSHQWKLRVIESYKFNNDNNIKYSVNSFTRKSILENSWSVISSPLIMGAKLTSSVLARGESVWEQMRNSEAASFLWNWFIVPIGNLWRWFVIDWLLDFVLVKWTIVLFLVWPMIAFVQGSKLLLSTVSNWIRQLFREEGETNSPEIQKKRRQNNLVGSKKLLTSSRNRRKSEGKGLKTRVKEWLEQRQKIHLRGTGEDASQTMFSISRGASSSQSASSINTNISSSLTSSSSASTYSSSGSQSSTASWYALRSPEAGFLAVQEYPFKSRYFEFLGYRIHYVDEQNVEMTVNNELIVLIHGAFGWSYGQRKVIEDLRDKGYRVAALDLIGYGKSDKCTLDMEPLESMLLHQQTIVRFLYRLAHGLGEARKETRLTLICEDVMTFVALMVLSQPLPFQREKSRLILVNAWKPSESFFELYQSHMDGRQVLLASLYYFWTRCLKAQFPLRLAIQLFCLEKWQIPAMDRLAAYEAPFASNLEYGKALDFAFKMYAMQPLILLPWHWIPGFAVPFLDRIFPSWLMYSSTREELVRCQDLILRDVPGSLSSILFVSGKGLAPSNPILRHHFPEFQSLLWSILEYLWRFLVWILVPFKASRLIDDEDEEYLSTSKRRRQALIRLDLIDDCRWLPMEEQPEIIANRVHSYIQDKFT